MSVIYDSAEPLDPIGQLYRWTFHSDRMPPVTLRVYVDGLLADTIASDDGTGQATLSGESEIEVLDKDAAVPRPAYPKRFTLYWAWQPNQGTVYFRVDQLVSAVWTERARIPDFGQGHFTWLTGLLVPTRQYQFRVVPVFSGLLEAAAIPFTATPVFRPRPPAVTYTYSSITRKVTIGA